MRIFCLGLALMLLQSSGGQEMKTQNAILHIEGGEIEITLPDEPMTVSSAQLMDWIKTAAGAVSEYYGHFPVPHLTLRVRTTSGSGIRHGVTYPRYGGLILISVGKDTSVDDLKTDWTLTHEMIHLAFPSMEDEQHWIEEGISTYVEPIARAQVGNMAVKEVWREFIRDMPQGQPADGDQGLDNTHTWGRTYWGGALFCLMADVQIRERTHNRKGLQDALRAIRNHGGTITEDWQITRAFSIGDQATGTRVLQDLYEQMANKPVTVDLDKLWAKLGLSVNGGEVQFNNKAADASIRKTLTAKKGSN